MAELFSGNTRAQLDNWIYDFNPGDPNTQTPPGGNQNLVVLGYSNKSGNLSVAVGILTPGVDPNNYSQSDIQGVYLVNRGTQFSDPQDHPIATATDLYNDAQIIFGTSGIARLQAAASYADQIVGQYQVRMGVPVDLIGQFSCLPRLTAGSAFPNDWPVALKIPAILSGCGTASPR